MIGEWLVSEVENFYSNKMRFNPLFQNARDGKLTAQEVGSYMTNVLYLIRHTPLYLSLAKKRSEDLGRHDLAAFFSDKLGEEVGHDQWAENDLQSLSQKFGLNFSPTISPAMSELVEYLGRTIEKDPALYIPYIFFAEYFTVVGTPEWLKDLQMRCQIPATMLSVLGNHAELDREHVKQDLRGIEALIDRTEYSIPCAEVLEKSMQYFEAFCADVGRVH